MQMINILKKVHHYCQVIYYKIPIADWLRYSTIGGLLFLETRWICDKVTEKPLTGVDLARASLRIPLSSG